MHVKTPLKTHEICFLTIFTFFFFFKDKLALSNASASLVGEPILIEKVEA